MALACCHIDRSISGLFSIISRWIWGSPDPENLKSNILTFRGDGKVRVKKRRREEARCGTEPGGGGLWMVMAVFGGCKSSFHAAMLKSCWEHWQLQESPVPLCSLAVQWVPGRARSDWSSPWQRTGGSLLSITPLSEPSRGLEAFTVLRPWERKQKIFAQELSFSQAVDTDSRRDLPINSFYNNLQIHVLFRYENCSNSYTYLKSGQFF